MQTQRGYQLTFFTQQDRKHGHLTLSEWLIEEARRRNIRGATMIPATEGYGQHRRIHSAHFFDLADQPLEITMAVTAEEADQFLAHLQAEKVHLFFTKTPIEFGVIGEP
jgi:PII-like signaling protein